jgi:glutamate transport system permease protein
MKGFTNDYADQRWGIFLAFALGYIILVELISAVAIVLERRWKVA